METSTRMKIALVGFGYWGPNLAKNIWLSENFNLLAICDLNKNRLDAAKAVYYDHINYYEKLDDMLDDIEVEAVAIAVDTNSHYDIAKICLNRNLHLFVEKPLSTNLNEVKNLCEIAKNRRLTIHVDHIMAYHPAIKKIKEIVDSGKLGKVSYIESSRMNLGRAKINQGPLWDLVVHDVAIVNFIYPKSKLISAEMVSNKNYSSLDSIVSVNLVYDKFVANLRASWQSPIKERRLMIIGDQSMLVFDDMEPINKLIVYDMGLSLPSNLEYKDYVVKNRIGDAIIYSFDIKDALLESLDSFFYNVRGHSISLSSCLEAIKITKILNLSEKSLK